MPWMETNVVDERRQFVLDVASGQRSMSELCERYAVSRPTGYKWLARQRAEGDAGLLDTSRAPHHCPPRTRDDVDALLLAARREYGSGRQEAGAGAHEATPGQGLAGTQHGQRHPRAARRAAQEPTASPVDAPGRRPAPHGAAEPSVADRLQRAVQNRRRALLLSADRHRP